MVDISYLGARTYRETKDYSRIVKSMVILGTEYNAGINDYRRTWKAVVLLVTELIRLLISVVIRKDSES